MIATLPPVKPVSLPEIHRLITLKHALGLEMKGLRLSRGSASVAIRRVLKDAERKTPRSLLELAAEYNTYLEQVKEVSKNAYNKDPSLIQSGATPKAGA